MFTPILCGDLDINFVITVFDPNILPGIWRNSILEYFSNKDPKTKSGAGPWKPEARTRSRRRKPEAGAGNNLVFFIGLRELYHSIKFLVKFGVGRRLVAWAIKLPCR
ncbi:hypothetical protein F2Q70_00031878 [Brassica cretica]|uniref:Uncharacterized protein n=1 Tax=Brassica cretica TaxID=69181 RepID=A0A8S9FE54_BRACR|nr:hypothetical protein F2Q70_00031878 [Brassica cretica]